MATLETQKGCLYKLVSLLLTKQRHSRIAIQEADTTSESTIYKETTLLDLSTYLSAIIGEPLLHSRELYLVHDILYRKMRMKWTDHSSVPYKRKRSVEQLQDWCLAFCMMAYL
uniref:Uncharacterized protein n=1 Tax=Opuntia streptacantha TaxID=393608 RepID=A0A7C9DVT3_OPUST